MRLPVHKLTIVLVVFLSVVGLVAALVLVNTSQDLRQQARVEEYASEQDRIISQGKKDQVENSPLPRRVTEAEERACSAGGGVIENGLCVATTQTQPTLENQTAKEIRETYGSLGYCMQNNPGNTALCQSAFSEIETQISQSEVDACSAGGGIMDGGLCVGGTSDHGQELIQQQYRNVTECEQELDSQACGVAFGVIADPAEPTPSEVRETYGSLGYCMQNNPNNTQLCQTAFEAETLEEEEDDLETPTTDSSNPSPTVVVSVDSDGDKSGPQSSSDNQGPQSSQIQFDDRFRQGESGLEVLICGNTCIWKPVGESFYEEAVATILHNPGEISPEAWEAILGYVPELEGASTQEVIDYFNNNLDFERQQQLATQHVDTNLTTPESQAQAVFRHDPTLTQESEVVALTTLATEATSVEDPAQFQESIQACHDAYGVSGCSGRAAAIGIGIFTLGYGAPVILPPAINTVGSTTIATARTVSPYVAPALESVSNTLLSFSTGLPAADVVIAQQTLQYSAQAAAVYAAPVAFDIAATTIGYKAATKILGGGGHRVVSAHQYLDEGADAVGRVSQSIEIGQTVTHSQELDDVFLATETFSLKPTADVGENDAAQQAVQFLINAFSD